jgi:hypothetical protein
MPNMLSTASALRLGAVAAVGAVLSVAPAALSAPDSAAETSRPICLDVNRIDHTEVLNNHQILFYEYGKKTWVNNLPHPCHTLTRQDGWVWESSLPKYCDNVELIRVLRTHEVCMLGAFTRYEKPPNAG